MKQLGGSCGCWEYMAYLEREVLLSEGAFFPPSIHSKFKNLENGNKEHAIRLKNSSTSLCNKTEGKKTQKSKDWEGQFHRDL